MRTEEVPVGKLKLADDNVRSEIGDVSELAESMLTVGVIEPLIVTPEYVVVAGARRLEAAKKAKLSKVPVVVREMTDKERLEIMLIENLQREDLTAIEEAQAYKRLRDLGLTQKQIAARVGKKQSWVSTRLSLLALPETTLKEVDAGKLAIGDAEKLAKVADDPKLVKKLTTKAVKGSKHVGLDVDQALEQRVREKTAAQKEAELKKKGETVVQLTTDTWGYTVEAPKGMKIVHANLVSATTIKMDPAAHAKLACHAAGVHPRDASVVEVCTDPSQHPDPQLQIEEARKKQAELMAERNRRKEAARAHRIDWCKVVGQKPVEKQIVEVAYHALVDDAWYGYGVDEMAFAILGLGWTDGDDLEGEEETTEAEAALAKVLEQPNGKQRVAWAFACSRLEANENLEPVIAELGYEPPAEEPEPEKPTKQEEKQEVKA